MRWLTKTVPPSLLFFAIGVVSPLCAHAQQPLGYPIDGLYLGAAGGFNIKGNESIKNLSSNERPFSSGLSTPNLNAALDLGGGAIGWGFGNGLRRRSGI